MEFIADSKETELPPSPGTRTETARKFRLEDDEWSVPASITFGDIDRHCDHRDVVYTNQKSARYDGAHTWGFQLDSIQIGHEHSVIEVSLFAFLLFGASRN